MARPKIFIASSGKNISIAKAFKNQLREYADADVWDEVFRKHNNESFLETLMQSKEDYEYGLFVWAADDAIANKKNAVYSPRDNVVFETGLFMGALGTPKIFIVYDDAIPLKTPTDFLGINLIKFNSKELKQKKHSAIKDACKIIEYEIKKQRKMFPYLQGTWDSAYEITYQKPCKMAKEELRVEPFKNGILITSSDNTADDSYTAYGRIMGDRIWGQWKSVEASSDKTGEFMLIVTPDKNSMYGYFTCADQRSGNVFATWLLTKKGKHNRNQAIRGAHLKELQELLLDCTFRTSFDKALAKKISKNAKQK